jgi:hypothetical protein
MKINNNGVTRIVFVFKHVVVKVPKPFVWSHFLRGILSNINEDNTWKWNTGKFEKGTSYLLCPVIWRSVGGWILIMKRAQPIAEKFDKIFKGDGTVIHVKLNCDEHIKYFPGDDTVSNYGKLDGRLVKIDYGELDVATSIFKSNSK